MNNTLYVQESTAFLNIHQGLFIDIFPVDKIYRGTLLRLQIALIGALTGARSVKLNRIYKKNSVYRKENQITNISYIITFSPKIY